MKIRRLNILLALSLTTWLFAESPVPRGGPHDYFPLPADLSSPAVFQRRFTLEQRRAGGPRPPVIEELLSEGLRSNSAMWPNLLLESCRSGMVDCGRYLEATREWARKQPAQSQESTDSAVKALAQEAEIQSMGPKRRQALYVQALREGAVYGRPSNFYLDAGDAARRVTRERITDLFEQVAGTVAAHPEMKAIAAELAVARISGAPDPDSELLNLVERGAEADLWWIKEAREACLGGRSVPDVTAQTAVSLGHLALDALRTRNSLEALKRLRGVVQLYVSASPLLTRRIEEPGTGEVAEVKRPQPCESSHFGLMGRHLFETVGDLGDRELERRTLGGRTLWDQVNDAEKALVKAGKLQRNAMIASTGQ